jgi:hypothetical protein
MGIRISLTDATAAAAADTMTPLHWGIAAFEDEVSSDLFPGASAAT